MVSPGEGLSVVRSVTVPVMVAARTVAVDSSRQQGGTRIRSVLFTINTA
jgi:hypothetical protein